MSLGAGSRLGPYEIVAPLGAGGMGEVYRARDSRLGREVAVKVLPESTSRDPEALARFEHEARAVAALSHPNILALYDIGHENGVAYAVAELLDGGTLRDRLTSGPLPLRKACDLAIQIAQGLAAAHERGIVHRDLKPENLFLTRDGRVKILDFGLARAPLAASGAGTDSPTIPRHTEPGTILGTAGYMSPEQARGLTCDHRSDLFSFGAVLFEMLAGRRAFRGETTAETLAAVLRDDPPEIPASGASSPLERLARRCLEKRPEERFQSARDIWYALEVFASYVPHEASKVGAGVAGGETRKSVAVLPFKNLGDLARDPASAHLGIGLADATITELSSVRSLLVRPTAATLRYVDHPAEPQRAGEELGVDAVVDASFQRAGSRLRVTVQLIETRDGSSLWGAKIDTSLDDIFQMQDEVSRKIAAALSVELSPADEQRLSRGPRAVGAAYDLYLKGRVHLLRDTLEESKAAIQSFERARDADPGFAPAWAGLADACVRMAFSYEPEGGWYERAEAMCAQALRIDPDLPEARYARARLLWSPQRHFDHAGALRELAAALVGRPSLNEAHGRAGIILIHLAMFEEAEAAFDRAQAINPDDPSATAHRGLSRYLQGHAAEAMALTEASVHRIAAPWTHYQLGLCLVRMGLLEQAAETAETISHRFPGDVLGHCLHGLLAASRGDAARAHRQIELVVRNRKAFGHYHHAQHDVACIYALLGEPEKALDWIEAAARNGFPCYTAFESDPLLASLRGETRFTTLMAELEAECGGYRKLYQTLGGRGKLEGLE